MPELNKKLFEGSGGQTDEEISSCEVISADSVNTILENYGWNEGAASCVVLSLSPDNRRVETGRFVTVGNESRDFAIAASKIWQDANMDVKLTVRLPTMESFRFSEGGLTSDLLNESDIVHFYHLMQDNGPATPILTPVLDNLGIGQFCVRLVCHISTTTGIRNGIRIKYHVMLYPMEGEEMIQQYQHASNPSWPGIRIGEGEMPLLPRTVSSWGCPILPLLHPGKTFAALPQTPSGADFRVAISAIINKSGTPDCNKNGAAVKAKWEKAARPNSEFQAKPAPISWPKEAARQPASG